MQIKKFEATTIQEALENVKKELGPEAIILKTKRNKAGFGLLSGASVEVTAAIPDKSFQKRKLVDSYLTERSREEIKNTSATKQSKIYDQEMKKVLLKQVNETKDKVTLSSKKYADIQDDEKEKEKPFLSADRFFGKIPFFHKNEVELPKSIPMPQQKIIESVIEKKETLSVLEQEIESLRGMIQDIKNNQISVKEPSSLFSNSLLKELFDQLLLNGIDQKMAMDLIRKVEVSLTASDGSNPERALEELACTLMEQTEVMDLLEEIRPHTQEESYEPVKIAFIGPTGVGKTTTLAKIAGNALLQKKLKVGLINLDFQKAGAFEQLKTYSQIFNIPYHSAQNKKELELAVEDLSSMDLILIDTAGYSHNDETSIVKLEDLLSTIPNLRTQLVLSSSTRDLELYAIGKKYSYLNPDGVIFSKLDESLSFGVLYNLSQKLRLPLTYFTHGQKVPDDIEKASKEKMASLLLDL